MLVCRFMLFFPTRIDNPELLMEAASGWVRTHQLNHFEKVQKIKTMVEAGQKLD